MYFIHDMFNFFTKCVLLLKGLPHQRKMTCGSSVRGYEKTVMKGLRKILFLVKNPTHTQKTQLVASAGIHIFYYLLHIIQSKMYCNTEYAFENLSSFKDVL